MTMTIPATKALEPPRYGLGHVGEFYVDNGVDLSPECQDVYSSLFYDSSNEMVWSVNNPSGRHVCDGLDVLLSLTAAYLSVEGSNVK